MKHRNKKFLTVLILFFVLCCKPLEAQNVVDSSKLSYEKRTLYVPPLEELKTVFEKELLKNFAEVTVQVVDCPNLKEYPFFLADSGLGGRPILLDVARMKSMFPETTRARLYDMKSIASYLNYSEAFAIGASSGPWPYLNAESDETVNMVFNKSASVGSTVAYFDSKNGTIVVKFLPLNETRFSAMGNFFLSEGKPGKVIKVHVKKRIGEENFIASMKKGLENHYPGKLVGLGGTFVLVEGKILLSSFEDYNEMLLQLPRSTLENSGVFHLFQNSAPMIAVGTFVSDKTNLDLEEQHFHTFSHHGEGGHYREGLASEMIEYLGYFNPGEEIYRVDRSTK